MRLREQKRAINPLEVVISDKRSVCYFFHSTDANATAILVDVCENQALGAFLCGVSALLPLPLSLSNRM
jgi:hypothetical protein